MAEKTQSEYRKDFLMKMYDQMCNEIDRQIQIIWQTVGTLVGAFAIFALIEKKVVSIDFASTFIILICAWLIAHVLESNYWYNRNIAIIANIEKEFLYVGDLKDIHYYFGKHRAKNRLLSNFRIQLFLALGIFLFIISYHFYNHVLPGFGEPWSNFEIKRALPYAVSIGCFILLFNFWGNRKKDYEEFLKNSPGKMIDTKGIEYGQGHPIT